MGNLTKSEMRKRVLAARPGNSSGLTEQLVSLAKTLNAKSIASYAPIKSEPNVSEFNTWVSNHGQLLLPRIEGDDLVFASGELEQGAYGLWQPKGEAIELEGVELFIVPALAADVLGNRLGKGKGFYDRLLAKVSAKVAAVVFENEVFESLEAEAHDRPVDYVVTPNRTVVCGG